MTAPSLLPALLTAALALATALPSQDPTPAAAPPAAAAVPEDVAEAVRVDVEELRAQLDAQPPARLAQLLEGWMALVQRQQEAVAAAEAAPAGSEERAQLEARSSDRDALVARAQVVIDELVAAAGADDAIAAAVERHRATIAELRTAEQEKALQTGTVPQDESMAQTLDIEVLKAQLRPLTKAQVEEEMKKWLELLQKKALEVRNVEVASLAAAQAEDVTSYNERAVALRTERDALLKRVRTVIDAYDAKGGEADEASAYADSLVATPPVTGVRAAWATFRAWLLNPEGGIALGKSVVFFLLILLGFKLLASLIGSFFDRAFRTVRRTSDLLRSFIVNSVRKVTMFIGLVIALSQLGVDIGPLLAAIGAAGFVIGFALQGTLSNFASGVMIMLYRPYDIADAVTVSGITGVVDGMNLVSTTIKTFDNQTIVVPNSKIWGDVITNITANATRRVDMVFGIGYRDDIGKAVDVLRGIVESHPKVLKTPEPVIRVGELADSSVKILVRPWTKTADYWDVYWDLQRAVKERFDQAGITIPFPQTDIHVHQVASGAAAAAAG